MVELSVNLLGSFQAGLGGRPLITFRTSHAKALLIVLVVEKEPAATWRPALMTLLWPGAPQISAQHNLRQAIYLLRQALAFAAVDYHQLEILQVDHQRLALSGAIDRSVDVDRFQRLLAQCRGHSHADLRACRDCESRLEQAAILYRGDFLADFYLTSSGAFENWAGDKRQALRRAALGTMGSLAMIRLRQGDFQQARRFARRQLNLDPLQEPAYQQLMEALAFDGRRHEALVVYKDCQKTLLRELGMVPSQKTVLLRDQIAAGDLSKTTFPNNTHTETRPATS